MIKCARTKRLNNNPKLLETLYENEVKKWVKLELILAGTKDGTCPCLANLIHQGVKHLLWKQWVITNRKEDIDTCKISLNEYMQWHLTNLEVEVMKKTMSAYEYLRNQYNEITLNYFVSNIALD